MGAVISIITFDNRSLESIRSIPVFLHKKTNFTRFEEYLKRCSYPFYNFIIILYYTIPIPCCSINIKKIKVEKEIIKNNNKIIKNNSNKKRGRIFTEFRDVFEKNPYLIDSKIYNFSIIIFEIDVIGETSRVVFSRVCIEST